MVTEKKGIKKTWNARQYRYGKSIPGLRGPHDNQTAAIAVALLEAAESLAFKTYGAQIVKMQKQAVELNKLWYDLVMGNRQSSYFDFDFTPGKVNGATAALALRSSRWFPGTKTVRHLTINPGHSIHQESDLEQSAPDDEGWKKKIWKSRSIYGSERLPR